MKDKDECKKQKNYCRMNERYLGQLENVFFVVDGDKFCELE